MPYQYVKDHIKYNFTTDYADYHDFRETPS